MFVKHSMKLVDKSVWKFFYCLFIAALLCSSCLSIDKVGSFEPLTINGWQEYKPRYNHDIRYYFIAQNIIYEIYPIIAVIEPCSAGFLLPIIPTGSCSDTRFSADGPLKLKVYIFTDKEIDIDTLNNFKPIVTTEEGTYTPIPSGQKAFYKSGGYAITKYPISFKYEEKVHKYNKTISYEYIFSLNYIIPEENLNEFLVEFPVNLPGINLPPLTFKYKQEVGIYKMGP
jgi:hypothetical protein